VAEYEGHTLAHLRGEVDVGHGLTLFGRLLNLTDARYSESSSYTISRGRELAPGLPRTFYGGIEVAWNR
jgi:outer membrane receptor protein involved in Fe transport